MRVVFMGFQTWGHVTLNAILQAGHEVPLVITHPESSHEYETIWNDSVRQLARSRGIPVIECQYARGEELTSQIRDTRPDVMLSSDWRTWIGPDIFTIPRFGTLNIHDALLPRYGGFAPINWAIINGEVETGVTVHYVDEAFDLGDILLQECVPIHHHDTATDVFKRTLPLFGTLAIRALDLIDRGQARRIPQDRSQATFFHKRSERDSRIDWNRSRRSIYNLIRAQSDPYPNAYTFHQSRKLKIKRASLASMCYCGSPGRVKSGVVVLGGPDATEANQGLVVEVVQVDQEPPCPANDYFTHMGDYLGEERLA